MECRHFSSHAKQSRYQTKTKFASLMLYANASLDVDQGLGCATPGAAFRPIDLAILCVI
jgi:hypothetical protein